MQIQVHTDKNVKASDGMVQHVEDQVEAAVSHFRDQITRVEVHLNDENPGGSGDADKRCMMEARAAGKQPVAVTHHAASVGEAYSGAAQKLKTAVEHRYGRSKDHKGAPSIRHLEASDELV